MTPETKFRVRIAIWVLLPIWFLLAIYFPKSVLVSSESSHLEQVEEHISKIRPQWDAFRKDNREFNDVDLFTYTGGGGMFGAWGQISSTNEQESLRRLKQFMIGTKPPRPIYLGGVLVLSPEVIEARKRNRAKKLQSSGGQARP